MLIRKPILEGIVEGRISLAFRRWRRPSVRPGTELRTPMGRVRVEAMEVIEEREVTDADARLAGFEDAAHVLRELRGRHGRLYRLRVAFAGADPRVALRQRSAISEDELDLLRSRLTRFDSASRHGPWTESVLDAIARDPGRPAAELASALGLDKPVLKRMVQKLKELGLTISLERGYRLSPRGEALRERL